jgi:hypothetical protein
MQQYLKICSGQVKKRSFQDKSLQPPAHAGSSLADVFYPEHRGDTFLRNVGSHKIYTAPHPRRRHSSICQYFTKLKFRVESRNTHTHIQRSLMAFRKWLSFSWNLSHKPVLSVKLSTVHLEELIFPHLVPRIHCQVHNIPPVSPATLIH